MAARGGNAGPDPRDQAASPGAGARVCRGLEEVDARPSAVSVGFFDGVHLGHQTIIREAAARANAAGLRSVVLTFDRHPLEVIRPGSEPPLLMTPERRARTLAELGVDLVVVLPFDDVLRHLAPDAFADIVLCGPVDARVVLVGKNFRFGHRASGDVDVLHQLGRDRGFETVGVPLLELDGVTVSSTEIRGVVGSGNVEQAARLLGRPHCLDGVVVRGDGRGAQLGFPTANLAVSERLAVPANGVYAGMCTLPDGRVIPAATNVGVSPTFGGREVRVEAHLLDTDEDLYGLPAVVDFRHRLRAEERFPGPQELVEQMHRDVEDARRLLGV